LTDCHEAYPDEKSINRGRTLAYDERYFYMKRLIMLLALVALAVPAIASAGSPGGSACTPTGFVRDGMDLTAAKIGGNLTGELDATGCDIGVFYGPGVKGSVNAAKIMNAKYFGVVNYRGNVDVKNSTISQIGNTPFDGTQHGVGILYTTEELPYGTTSGMATGTISGNVVSSYQKGGITVRGAGASAQVESNKVTGNGPVSYIAQNGIQVSFDGSATVKRNTVSGHSYTPADTTACGLLFFNAASDAQKLNTLSGNQQDVCVVHA